MAGGQILAFAIDLLRRPYNTLALPYECVIRGIVTGWTGVAPLLPEVVPEIDANQVSFCGGGRGSPGRSGWSLTHQSVPYVNFKVAVLEFAYR